MLPLPLVVTVLKTICSCLITGIAGFEFEHASLFLTFLLPIIIFAVIWMPPGKVVALRPLRRDTGFFL